MDVDAILEHFDESKSAAYGKELEDLTSRVLDDILSFIFEFVEKVYEEVEERPSYNVNYIVFPDDDKGERESYRKSSMVTMMSNENYPKTECRCRIKRIIVEEEKFNDKYELLLKGTPIYKEDMGQGGFKKAAFEITVEDLFSILGFFEKTLAIEEGYYLAREHISYSELLDYNRLLRVKKV